MTQMAPVAENANWTQSHVGHGTCQKSRHPTPRLTVIGSSQLVTTPMLGQMPLHPTLLPEILLISDTDSAMDEGKHLLAIATYTDSTG